MRYLGLGTQNARLTKALDSHVILLQDADGQLSRDIYALQMIVEATGELASENHDEALNRLKKFHISHRIHPKVWEFAKRTLTNETTKLVWLSNVLV